VTIVSSSAGGGGGAQGSFFGEIMGIFGGRVRNAMVDPNPTAVVPSSGFLSPKDDNKEQEVEQKPEEKP